LRAIDRRFFREPFESSSIIANVARGCRRATTVAQLDHLVTSEMDRALHVSRAALLALDSAERAYRAGNDRVPALPAQSRIAELLRRGDPIDLTARESRHLLGDWTEGDRAWLAAAQAKLLVPVMGGEGNLLGLLVLGDKLSELPFAEQDRSLVAALGETLSASLEQQLSVTSEPPADAPPGRECQTCYAIAAPTTTVCQHCGGRLALVDVPHVLKGKYRLIERLGSGGMGVVYRALDQGLGREVAVKTLPRVGSPFAPRLRREARAMAAVSHPNLAAIYGLEAWGERPMLIVEYLPQGTLANRLTKGPLPVREALTIGCQLAGGLAHLHQSGIMHRDIKPSNIGFARDGQPKLLDFGLAKLIAVASSTGAGDHDTESFDSTTSGAFLGTIPYMSPEAARGEAAKPSFDLWALAVTLFEAISGRNPFSGGEPMAALLRLSTLSTPDLRMYSPNIPEAVRSLFQRLLAADAEARPQTAEVFGEWLTATLRSLPA